MSKGLVWVVPQVSLNAGKTLLGKACLQEFTFNLADVTVHCYHIDNGAHASSDFKQDCSDKGHIQSFSGIGAQHQNAHAERNIQTLNYWARTMMVHFALHWPSDSVDKLYLWSFKISCLIELTPLEIFVRTKSNHQDLLQTHVWGCPDYVTPKSRMTRKFPIGTIALVLVSFLVSLSNIFPWFHMSGTPLLVLWALSIMWCVSTFFRLSTIILPLKIPLLHPSTTIILTLAAIGMEIEINRGGKLTVVGTFSMSLHL